MWSDRRDHTRMIEAIQRTHSGEDRMEEPALQILKDNRIMSIATVRPDGWPQSTIVGYANEGWRLYFLVYRASQKFENISHNNRVSVSIGHEPSELRQKSRVWMLLAERHPNLTDLAPPGNAEVATMVAECRHVSVLDYSQALGHTESLTIGGSEKMLGRHRQERDEDCE